MEEILAIRGHAWQLRGLPSSATQPSLLGRFDGSSQNPGEGGGGGMLYGTQAGLGQAPSTWPGEWSIAGGDTTWYEIPAAACPH